VSEIDKPWKRVTNGRATVSWGKPFYGQPRLMANVPVDAIDDLIEALAIARHMIESGQ
jgi:hypothetical protein